MHQAIHFDGSLSQNVQGAWHGWAKLGLDEVGYLADFGAALLLSASKVQGLESDLPPKLIPDMQNASAVAAACL